MAKGTGVEWTELTWNPVTGCTKISPGGKCCYVERMTEHLQAMGRRTAPTGFNSLCNPACWSCPWAGKTTDHLRKLNEQPAPQGHATRLYPTSL